MMQKGLINVAAGSDFWRLSLATFAALSCSFVQAELEYNGQNTLTLEHYDVKGEGGLYTNEGLQKFDDFSLNFSYTHSAYQSARGYVQASSNHSDYRQPDRTIVHSASLNYQNGEASIPLRLDVGDFYASHSRRTLQQGLKGIQLEFQPVGMSVPQSIQIFWGRQAQDYDEFTDGDKNYYWGASWLIEQTTAGSFALTSVNYNNDQLPGHDDTEEQVTSIAWQKSLQGTGFSHSFEAEFAYLSGENATDGTLSGRSDFFQVSGFGQSGQNYLMSYEKNGREYTPAGSSLYSDRESINANWTQKLYGQMNVNLRGQRYKDFLSTANPVTSNIYGINLVGLPFTDSEVNANLDLSLREVTDRDDTRDQDNWNARLDVSHPMNDRWRNRFSYQWQQVDNKIGGDKSHRRTLSLAADVTREWRDWQATITPSINYSEDIDINSQQQDNMSFGLSVSARTDSHSLLFSHQRRDFETDNDSGLDSQTVQTRLQWRTQWKAHSFEFNIDHYNFDREQTDESDSIKATLAWTYNFSKPKYSRPIVGGEKVSLASFGYLDDLQLNRFYDDSLDAALVKAGWSGSGNSGRYSLYEGKLLQTIDQRQVLVLGMNGAAVSDAGLLIALPSDSASALRLYRKVLDELLKTYGSPSRERRLGDFDAGWQIAVNRDELIRIVEWQTRSGILRFGIPRPRVGGIRLELQLRDHHSTVDSTDWGLSVAQ